MKKLILLTSMLSLSSIALANSSFDFSIKTLETMDAVKVLKQESNELITYLYSDNEDHYFHVYGEKTQGLEISLNGYIIGRGVLTNRNFSIPKTFYNYDNSRNEQVYSLALLTSFTFEPYADYYF